MADPEQHGSVGGIKKPQTYPVIAGMGIPMGSGRTFSYPGLRLFMRY